MTGRKLFVSRVYSEWKFQWCVFRSITDWTVLLYIVLPGVLIATGSYISWWLETPNWIEPISITTVFFIVYIVCWFGEMRTFFKEADQLFLWQKSQVITDLKKSSFTYSLVIYTISVIFVILAFTPFLINFYQLSWSRLFLLILFFASCKMFVLAVKFRLDLNHFLVKYLLNGAIFVVIGTYVILTLLSGNLLLLFINALLFFVGCLLLIGRKKESFFKDVQRDQRQKLKYVRFVYQFSDGTLKTSKLNRKHPFLLPRSRRIFKVHSAENALVELFIKAFVRNGQYLFHYFYIIGITVSALLILPPLWMKWGVYILFVIFLKKWLIATWKSIISHHFLTSLQGKVVIEEAQKRSVRLFLIPAITIVGAVTVAITWIRIF